MQWISVTSPRCLSLSYTFILNKYRYLHACTCFLSHTPTLSSLIHTLSRYFLSCYTSHLVSVGRCHVNGISVKLSVPVTVNHHAHAQELASDSASASSTSTPTQEHAKEESVILRSPVLSSDFDQPSSRSIHLQPSQRVKKVGITSGNIIDCLSITIAEEDGLSGEEKEKEVTFSVLCLTST
jgi:hypothetical protein